MAQLRQYHQQLRQMMLLEIRIYWQTKQMLLKDYISFVDSLILTHSKKNSSLFHFEEILKNFGSERIQKASFFHNECSEEVSDLKIFKTGDWPFPLSGFNFIGLYFFFNQNSEFFKDEFEIYKFMTLCFYSLKENGLIFILNFESGESSDFENLLKNIEKFSKIKNKDFQPKIKKIDFNTIIYNCQKINFKDLTFLSDEIPLLFSSYKEFFDFLIETDLINILFSSDQKSFIIQNFIEISEFLNLETDATKYNFNFRISLILGFV
jgi:hypothetical protein